MSRPRQRYTPQEAAALIGVRLQRIQNAITGRRLGRGFRLAGDGRRLIDLPALLTFAALDGLGKVRVEPAMLYRKFREVGVPRGQMRLTDTVSLDASKLLAGVVRNLELYDKAKGRITSDPGVMGGLPVVRGTRIPVRTLHARIKGGDSMESVLEDYPYLDSETVEAAVLYAEANPRRGRPRRRSSSTPFV